MEMLEKSSITKIPVYNIKRILLIVDNKDTLQMVSCGRIPTFTWNEV